MNVDNWVEYTETQGSKDLSNLIASDIRDERSKELALSSLKLRNTCSTGASMWALSQDKISSQDREEQEYRTWGRSNFFQLQCKDFFSKAWDHDKTLSILGGLLGISV